METSMALANGVREASQYKSWHHSHSTVDGGKAGETLRGLKISRDLDSDFGPI
jgi:hypothetical protein